MILLVFIHCLFIVCWVSVVSSLCGGLDKTVILLVFIHCLFIVLGFCCVLVMWWPRQDGDSVGVYSLSVYCVGFLLGPRCVVAQTRR